jgi:hypothetical protein
LPDTRESLGKYQDFPLLKSNFPRPKSNFPQRLSNFLQGLFAFLSSFLLSSMAFRFFSMAFRFPRNPRKSTYGGKYTKDHYSSFVFPATRSPSFVIPATAWGLAAALAADRVCRVLMRDNKRGNKERSQKCLSLAC